MPRKGNKLECFDWKMSPCNGYVYAFHTLGNYGERIPRCEEHYEQYVIRIAEAFRLAREERNR